MCGFLGFIDYEKKILKEKFEESVDSLILRGPDEKGINIHHNENYNVGLGHRRLSILDLDKRSNQPFYDHDYGVIFNGEIYNFKSVKEELLSFNHNFSTTSDTEVIIKAYKQWGLQCVSKFIGMFAFAIYDMAQQKIHLVRDRLGVKPLYLYSSKNAIMFSSDSLAINTLLHKTLKIDESALNGFFSLGYIPGKQSIFKSISKVKPGYITSIDLDQKKIKTTKYWDVKDFFDDKEFTTKDSEKLKNLLEDAIKLRLVSDVEVGSYLSGGLDSSYTTKILSENSKDKIRTFTVGFNEEFDEAPHAKEVADLIDTIHTTYYITPQHIKNILSNYATYFTEPFADNTALPMLYLSQNAKKQVKVVISSDGGDELFAGYYIHINLLKYNEQLKKIPRFLRPAVRIILKISYAITPHNFNVKNRLWKLKNIIHSDNDKQFRNLIFYGSRLPKPLLQHIISKTIVNKKLKHFFNFNKVKTNSNLKKMLFIDINERLANQMLVKVDKSTMGMSIEGREPLLDHRLYEFMFSFSENSFIKNGETKFQFRKIINEEFNHNKILHKPKKSFETPLLKWLKTHYSEYVENEIKSISSFNIPYINQKNVLNLWSDYLNLPNNKKELIWRVLVFIQWYKKHKL